MSSVLVCLIFNTEKKTFKVTPPYLKNMKLVHHNHN